MNLRDKAWPSVLLVLAPAIIVAALFISFHVADQPGAPSGRDTSFHLWRATLVSGEGLDDLAGSWNPPFREEPYRAGSPALAGFLDTLGGIDPLALAFAMPALMGTLVALAAGAFATAGAREPPWGFPVYALTIGTSAGIVLTAVGRWDNILIVGLAMAAATTALLVADGRRATAATVLLLAGATLVHWSITLYFFGILGLLFLALIPESLRARREGTGLLATPSGRLGVALGTSVVAGGAALAFAPAAPGIPQGWAGRVFRKLDKFGYRFAFMAPGVAGGVVALLFPRDARRRRALLLTAIWAATAGLSVAVTLVVALPAHRILPSAMGIPLLTAAALTGVGRLVGGRPLPLRAIGAGLVLAGLAGVALIGRGAWTGTPPEQAELLAESRGAGRYLSSIHNERPVIFVVNIHYRGGIGNSVRTGLPADQIRLAHTYVGDTDKLLRGERTFRFGVRKFNRISRRYWEELQPVLDEDPLVLWLAAFNPGATFPRGTVVAPGIVVVRGPTPLVSFLPPPRIQTPSGLSLAGTVAGAFLLFGAVGLGFARWLLPTGWMERAALAPALGIAVLVLGGVVASKLGASAPIHRWWIAVLLAAVGWTPDGLRWWRNRRGTC